MKEIEFHWTAIGAKLASLSDTQQAAFFTGFAKEIDSFDTHYSKESQMFFVKDLLKPEIREILKRYLPCIWYEEENQ